MMVYKVSKVVKCKKKVIDKYNKIIDNGSFGSSYSVWKSRKYLDMRKLKEMKN